MFGCFSPFQTAFLVVQEILNESVEKARAEIVSQFIKIAKVLLYKQHS